MKRAEKVLNSICIVMWTIGAWMMLLIFPTLITYGVIWTWKQYVMHTGSFLGLLFACLASAVWLLAISKIIIRFLIDKGIIYED